MHKINKLPLPSRIKAYLQSYWGLVDVLRLRDTTIRASLRDPPGTFTTQYTYISWNQKN